MPLLECGQNGKESIDIHERTQVTFSVNGYEVLEHDDAFAFPYHRQKKKRQQTILI